MNKREMAMKHNKELAKQGKPLIPAYAYDEKAAERELARRDREALKQMGLTAKQYRQKMKASQGVRLTPKRPRISR